MNARSPFIIILLLLASFVPPRLTQAVVPAPDGGYPGGNTAEGTNALLSLIDGTYNTAVGLFSLENTTGGSFNTATGAGALLTNNADENTATGAGALLSKNTGVNNTADGAFALFSNTIGSANTANGAQALFSNTIGFQNTATGFQALAGNTEGSSNTAVGIAALFVNTTGGNNTAIGSSALGSNTTGIRNIALGFAAGGNVTTANNVIAIGHGSLNVDNSCFIGNIREAQIGNDAVTVMIDSFGKLGTTVSSRRFKKEIQPMDSASEAILALKPVTFHYKSDTRNTPQFGLIAEEVAEVNQDLVVRDKDGEIYSVRYEAVNAMLLNEFLKEHRKMEDLEAIVKHQQDQIQALVTSFQKVNARVDAIPVPQLVATNPRRYLKTD